MVFLRETFQSFCKRYLFARRKLHFCASFLIFRRGKDIKRRVQFVKFLTIFLHLPVCPGLVGQVFSNTIYNFPQESGSKLHTLDFRETYEKVKYSEPNDSIHVYSNHIFIIINTGNTGNTGKEHTKHI